MTEPNTYPDASGAGAPRIDERGDGGCAPDMPDGMDSVESAESAKSTGGMASHIRGRIMPGLRRAGLVALRLILPPRCAGCGQITDRSDAVCATCWGGLRFITAPLCACCGLPFEMGDDPGNDWGNDRGNDVGGASATGRLCASCIVRPPAYDLARAALAYDDASRPFLLRFKHGDRTDMAPLLARWLWQAGRDGGDGATPDFWRDCDLIVPVPLHRGRLLMRRYNQSALLAQALSKMTGIGWDGLLLRRHRSTRSLAGLGRDARQREVGGAFSVDPGRAGQRGLAGARVVLVDDVLTTGATAGACARILKRAGASHVRLICLARVVR